MTAATREAPPEPWETQVAQDFLAGHQWAETPYDPGDGYVFNPDEIHFPGTDIVPADQPKRAVEEPLERLHKKANAIDVIPVSELSILQRATRWFKRQSLPSMPGRGRGQNQTVIYHPKSSEVDVYAERGQREVDLGARREAADAESHRAEFKSAKHLSAKSGDAPSESAAAEAKHLKGRVRARVNSQTAEGFAAGLGSSPYSRTIQPEAAESKAHVRRMMRQFSDAVRRQQSAREGAHRGEHPRV